MLATAICLAGCASHSKHILLYASSDIQVDNSQQQITVTDGTTQVEKELVFSGSDPVTLNITGPSGKYSLSVSGDGYFVANLKTDTVVGSYQHVGMGEGEGKITQDQLVRRIDSLKQLIAGLNISPAARNYFLPPGKFVKVSDRPDVKVFGPFTSIPAAFDAGSVPELYKFYTNKEVREIIAKLEPMTQYKPGEDAGTPAAPGAKK